ncbi:Oidioi.mRNA.OKI2018_I69.XSR.g14153.t1.cds [Oikopleura dioica]|uniref:Oidioi.mRNA.OKI2018_I69.XSR.g14153.t1.cds n=1 Tax=Oikopleura dioica TaxID=34765 RepID=A0ABN7SG75_OIKDI|nr:Oidioi.mRNA.OKI2018_I69.XSR.g14153.t1.cds [Oikopleura dioica]
MLEALRRLLESLSGDAAAQLPKLGTLYSSFLENNEDSGVDLSETSSSSLSLLFALDNYQHSQPHLAKELVEATERFKMSGAFGSFETSQILKFLFYLSSLNKSSANSTLFSERTSVFSEMNDRLNRDQQPHSIRKEASVFDEYSTFHKEVKSLINRTKNALDLSAEQISKDMFDHSTYHLFSKRSRLSAQASVDSGIDSQFSLNPTQLSEDSRSLSSLFLRANTVEPTTRLASKNAPADGSFSSAVSTDLNPSQELKDSSKACGPYTGRIILSQEELQKEIKLYITGHSSHLSLDDSCLAEGLTKEAFESERKSLNENRELIFRVKEMIDEYAKSDRIVRQKLSWSLRNIVIAVESCIFSLKIESVNEIKAISKRLFGDLAAIHACALMLGEKSSSIADIISNARINGVLQYASLMIRDLTVPVLDSVYSWIYLDQHCGLLTESIVKDYNLQHRRDRSCWDSLFRLRPDAHHNPLIYKLVPTLLLVTKSCHILRIMTPDHPLFHSNVPQIREMSKTSVEKWKKEYSSWIAESYIQIETRKEEHYESIRKDYERLQEKRRKKNEQIDLKAEKLRVKRAIELRNRQLSFRSMLNQQISDKIRLRKLQQELEEIEEQSRKKYINEKERLIEEEKARLIEEYQKKENEKSPEYILSPEKIDEEVDLLKEQLQSRTNESESVEEMEIDGEKESRNDEISLQNNSSASFPMEVDQQKPHVSEESATTESGATFIPRKKVISGKGISESGFVRGTIITKKAWEEMEREEQAIKPRERVITQEEFMQKVNFEVESVIRSQRESSRRENPLSSVTTYLEEDKPLDTQEVIDFFNNVDAVLKDPIKIYASLIKDALMFEIMEIHDMIGYLQATSQLVWFQDGVFSMAFFDEIFPLVTGNFEGGASMLNFCLNRCKLSTNMIESQKHIDKLYIDFAKNRSENKSPLSNLKGLSLYLDSAFPHNLIVDEQAQETYREVNKFLFDMRFAIWNLQSITYSQRGQTLTYELRKLNLIRNEMTVFVGQYYNFICTFMMQAQWKKLEKDLEKLKRAGELTIDSLKKAHDEYLHHIKTGCLLTNDMKRFLAHKNKMMSNIVMFCVCFGKYLVAEDEELLYTAFAAGKSFRDSVRFFCDLMRSLEVNLGIEGFSNVYDYNNFYVDENLRLPEIIEICSPHRRKSQAAPSEEAFYPR